MSTGSLFKHSALIFCMDPKKLICLWVVWLHTYPTFLKKALLQHYHKAMMHISITEVTSLCSHKYQYHFQKNLTVLLQNRHWYNLHENAEWWAGSTTGKCKTFHVEAEKAHILLTLVASLKTLLLMCAIEIYINWALNTCFSVIHAF